MGVPISTLWYAESLNSKNLLQAGGLSDRQRAQERAQKLFPCSFVDYLQDITLLEAAAPDPDHLAIGVFDQLTFIGHADFIHIAQPSQLSEQWLKFIPAQAVYLIAAAPDHAWASFASWRSNVLDRSYSSDPIDIDENIGVPQPFEGPFWAGKHQLRYAPGVAPDPGALPFHPQELAEQANRAWLGFRYTKPLSEADIDPATITVQLFHVHRNKTSNTTQSLDKDVKLAAAALSREPINNFTESSMRVPAGVAAPETVDLTEAVPFAPLESVEPVSPHGATINLSSPKEQDKLDLEQHYQPYSYSYQPYEGGFNPSLSAEALRRKKRASKRIFGKKNN